MRLNQKLSSESYPKLNNPNKDGPKLSSVQKYQARKKSLQRSKIKKEFCNPLMEWDSLCLERLMDETTCLENDHLPMEQQLKFYKQRDLVPGKLFNIGRRLWPDGGPGNIIPKRTRVFEMKYDSDVTTQTRNTVYNRTPTIDAIKPLTNTRPPPIVIDELVDKSDNEWLKKRVQLRRNLDDLALSEDYLSRKTDLSALEKRVLHNMKRATGEYVDNATNSCSGSQYSLDPSSIKSTATEQSTLRDVNSYFETGKLSIYPAIRCIEKHLLQRKLRLIDVFKDVDKKKQWKITAEEFRNALENFSVHIPEDHLSNLITALVTKDEGMIEFQDLWKTFRLYRLRTIEDKRKRLDSCIGEVYDTDMKQAMERWTADISEHSHVTYNDNSPPSHAHHQQNTLSSMNRRTSGTQQHARAPRMSEPINYHNYTTRPEVVRSARRKQTNGMHLPMSPRQKQQQLLLRADRKSIRNRPSVVITCEDQNTMCQDPRVLEHLADSTMVEENVEQLKKFRNEMYKSYLHTCEQYKLAGDVLTVENLKKAFLYPGDKKKSLIKNHIRQPVGNILYASLLKTACPTTYGLKMKSRGNLKRNEVDMLNHTPYRRRASIENMRRRRHSAAIAAETSAALENPMPPSRLRVISRADNKVDCWISFEQYLQIVSEMVNGHTLLGSSYNSDHCWPGKSDSVVNVTGPSRSNSGNAVFTTVNEIHKKSKPLLLV